MKITDVEVVRLLVPLEKVWVNANTPGAGQTDRTVLIVKVHTDAGIIGLGDAWHTHVKCPEPIACIVENVLKPALIGENPCDIGRLFEKMRKTIRHLGTAGNGAIAGVDMALWDILGKKLNAPIYALLGADTPSYMQPYVGSQTMGWKDLDKLDELVEEARVFVNLGYKALKIRGGRGLPDRKEDVESFRVMREAFGDSITLMYDVNNSYTLRSAEIMAKECDKYNIFWMEDPIIGLGTELQREYASLAAAVTVPITRGGNVLGPVDLRRLIEAGGIDIVGMDASSAGGISNIIKMAHMASAFGIRWAPNTHEPLGVLATLQVAAAMPLVTAGMYCEWDAGWPYDKFFVDPPRFENGVIVLPSNPGLGSELREDFIQKYKVDRY